MTIPTETFVLPLNVMPGTWPGPTIEQLRSMLASHLDNETKSLEAYGRTIKEQGSPLVKFVLNLILADEETHHGVLRRVVETLDSELYWSKSAEQLPRLGDVSKADAARLLQLTDDYIAEEKHGIAQCKSLMKSSKGLYSDLVSLLLNIMVHDSQKHLMMLKFVRKQLKAARAAA